MRVIGWRTGSLLFLVRVIREGFFEEMTFILNLDEKEPAM